MHYATIKKRDVANGVGVRVSVFVSGCTHRCPGCFNEVAWDFLSGEEYTPEVQEEILAALEPSFIQGLSLLGGEPMERANQKGLLPLLREAKKRFPQKDIWCYTGYLFDQDIVGRMMKDWPETRELMSYIDIMVDGKFVEAEKSLSLKFKGSRNQRIIQVQPSLEQGKVILDPLND